MSKEKVLVKTNNGISFCGLLAILFIALKLTNVIAWSWLWVLAPLWIGFALAIIVLFCFILFAGALIWLEK